VTECLLSGQAVALMNDSTGQQQRYA